MLDEADLAAVVGGVKMLLRGCQNNLVYQVGYVGYVVVGGLIQPWCWGSAGAS